MGRTSKLTEKQWKEVDDRLRNGEKPLLLAKEYKISKSLVYDRLSGKVSILELVGSILIRHDRITEKLEKHTSLWSRRR